MLLHRNATSDGRVVCNPPFLRHRVLIPYDAPSFSSKNQKSKNTRAEQPHRDRNVALPLAGKTQLVGRVATIAVLRHTFTRSYMDTGTLASAKLTDCRLRISLLLQWYLLDGCRKFLFSHADEERIMELPAPDCPSCNCDASTASSSFVVRTSSSAHPHTLEHRIYHIRRP